MNAKAAKYSLGILIIGLYLFVGTFGWFMLFKERVCAKSLYSADCYQTYQGFMHKEFYNL